MCGPRTALHFDCFDMQNCRFAGRLAKIETPSASNLEVYRLFPHFFVIRLSKLLKF